MPSSEINAAWPCKTPSSPSAPGSVTSTMLSLRSLRSGVTITSWMASAGISALRARLHFFGFFEHFFDRADHVKRLLRNVIILAFDDFLEAANGVFNLHVFAIEAGELRSDEHRLRKKLFDLAGTSHGPLVVVGKLFDTENRNNVLQILV